MNCECDTVREIQCPLHAAAPDLLAALKDMLPYVTSCVEERGDAAWSDAERIRAAIHKAEGKEVTP